MDNSGLQLSDGEVRAKQLADGGFTEEEINNWKAQTADNLTAGGFSAKEVRDYFGVKEPDMSATKAHVQAQLKAQPAEAKPKREPIDTSLKPVQSEDIWDALAAGWGNSILGLMTRGEESPLVANPDSIGQSFVAQTSQLLGDAPAMGAGMVGGALAGGTAGTATLPVVGTVSGAVVGGSAGAFAVPAAMRKILIDHYQKGDIQDARDFAERVVGTTWEATKGAMVGAASALAGGAATTTLARLGNPAAKATAAAASAKLITDATARAGAEAVASDMLANASTTSIMAHTTARLSSEVAAQTTVAAALEGHLPSQRDFINGAVAIGGLHAIGFGLGKVDYVAKKMMKVYAETGARPEEIVEAASKDPAFKGELLSDNLGLQPEQPNPDAPVVTDGAASKPEKLSSNEQMVQAAQDEILGRIGEKIEPEKQSLTDKVSDSFNSLYAKHLDYTKVVQDIVKEISPNAPLDDNNAEVLFRLHNGIQSKIREFVEHGTRDFETQNVNGESFMDIVNDIKKQYGTKGLDKFKAYGIAANSLELSERGIEQPGDRAIDRAFVEAHPEMRAFLDRYVSYRNRILDYLGASGRYSKDAIDAMKQKESYFPMKKILEPDPLTGQTFGSSKEIKAIDSSNLQLIDPIAQTLTDVSNMIKLAHETEATNTLIDQMKGADIPEDFLRKAENQQGMIGKTQIAYWENGERTVYDVPAEVAETVKRMAGNKPAVKTWAGALQSYFAASQRIGSVNNPMFAFRHAWRNQLTAPTLSETGLKPFQALMYAPEFFAKGDSYHNFVNDGGAIDAVVPMDKGYLDGKIYELDTKAPFLGKVWNGIKSAGAFSHWAILQNDNLLRFAEYKRMLEQGATRAEAAFAAREVLPDFQKQGLVQSALLQHTAFLRVHLQGLARMGQALDADFQAAKSAESPMDLAAKLGTGYVAKSIAMFTVPSLLLAAAQSDDDTIKDLPKWQKYNYWNMHISNWRPANSLAEAMSVKNAYPSNVRQMPDGSWQVNDGWVARLQKPFTAGVFFASAPEAALESWQKKDPKAFAEWAKSVAETAVAIPIPTMFQPIAEQAMNRNFYTGQPVVRHSMENKLPEMQYDRYTSETAKKLAEMISYVPALKDVGPRDAKLASPVVIQNYISTWGGTLGRYATDIVDKSLEKAGVVPEKVKPEAKITDIPFVREFFVRHPDLHADSVSEFQDRYGEADKIKNSIRALIKQGDMAGAIKLQDRYEVHMSRLVGSDKAILNLQTTIQKVYQAPDIDPVQKRQLIDGMTYQMIAIAKHGNETMDQIEKEIKNKKAGK